LRLLNIDAETNESRREFFQSVFGDCEGLVCIGVLNRQKKMKQEFFQYPEQIDDMLEHINMNYHSRNLYFCPQLLSEKKRRKESVSQCPVVWADLDECDWKIVDPKPSLVIESSPNRFQAMWFLDKPADPADGEDASHRIAYKYEDLGADLTGWDLSQFLRVPLTYNIKYGSGSNAPITQVIEHNDNVYSIEEFQKLEQIPGLSYDVADYPQGLEDQDPDPIFERHKHNLSKVVLDLYSKKPTKDWSAALWRLENELLEAGLSQEETFIICWNAKCNKYARDKRPPEHLWIDVSKADTRVEAHHSIGKQTLPSLLSDGERKIVDGTEGFVERYVQWARSRSDASAQYHEGTAFVVLSTMLAGVLKLKANFGTVIPNIWLMILADTTLTRKSTAMNMAMDLIDAVYDDALLATEATTEGIMQALSLRAGKPSVFHRDEFTGLLEGMKRKDYLSGLMEVLTGLYDGRKQTRQLRKEKIEVRDPVLILLCGGIKSRTFELMDVEHITSGFIPRFIFITAESDMTRYKPVGPLSEAEDDAYQEIVQELGDIKDLYTSDITMRVMGQPITKTAEFPVEMSEDAWERYQAFEIAMVSFGLESDNSSLYTPVMDRLSKTGLKCAMLIAAARQDPFKHGTKVVVEESDMLVAISYIERWRRYSIEIIEATGKPVAEKRIEQVFKIIHNSKGVVQRSHIMQRCHLTARDADWIFETLVQRGLIAKRRDKRAVAFVSLSKPD
jgi:hypothetical protein